MDVFQRNRHLLSTGTSGFGRSNDKNEHLKCYISVKRLILPTPKTPSIIVMLQQTEIVIHLLKSRGVLFDRGLKSEELETIERTFNFLFPPELRLFLEIANPISEKFVNWRYALKSPKGYEEAKARLNQPLEGIVFDVKHNDFWLPNAGDKPEYLNDQIDLIEKYIANQPPLIPIYSHRYAVSGNQEGTPVLSIWQTDIIYYGSNLFDYFANEFRLPLPSDFASLPSNTEVPFWSKMAG